MAATFDNYEYVVINIYIMLNYNRKQEKIALYRYKDVCNKNPRLQFNVTTQYAYKFVAKITTTL